MDIDYVIAWVNEQDPNHIAARKKYAPNDKKTHSEATTNERYQNNGELYYHIASLIKYAPFIRCIIIVSDNQKPEFLDAFVDEKKCAPSFIQRVSYDDIFAGLNATRPSFNARAIETCLWRIPDLSNHFVYANDDFFINAPLKENDFFEDEKPVLYGHWKKPENSRLKYRLRALLEKISSYRYTTPNHGLSQWKGAVLSGIQGDYFNVHHYPHPLRRSTLEQFFEKNKEILNHQVSFRYRDVEQFNVVSLANNLEIAQNNVPVSAHKGLAYVDFIKPKRVDAALDDIIKEKSHFGYVQGFELFSAPMRTKIHHILLEKFDDVLPQAIKEAIKKEIASW